VRLNCRLNKPQFNVGCSLRGVVYGEGSSNEKAFADLVLLMPVGLKFDEEKIILFYMHRSVMIYT
jgi:hypothetical protein